MAVRFDEESPIRQMQRPKKVGALTKMCISLGLAAGPKEAQQVLGLLAMFIFAVTLFLFWSSQRPVVIQLTPEQEEALEYERTHYND